MIFLAFKIISFIRHRRSIQKKMTLEEARKLVGNKWNGPGHMKIDDWLNHVGVLQALNELGYENVWHWTISNLYYDVNDVRIIPIILEKLGKYKNLADEGVLISQLAKPLYRDAVPMLIERYKSIDFSMTSERLEFYTNIEPSEKSIAFRFRIGETICLIKCKDYVDDYLELITNDNYIIGCGYIIALLCKLRETRAIDPILRLLREFPKMYKWSILKHIGWYKDPELIKYVEPFLSDSDFRKMAKQSIEKLQK